MPPGHSKGSPPAIRNGKHLVNVPLWRRSNAVKSIYDKAPSSTPPVCPGGNLKVGLDSACGILFTDDHSPSTLSFSPSSTSESGWPTPERWEWYCSSGMPCPPKTPSLTSRGDFATACRKACTPMVRIRKNVRRVFFDLHSEKDEDQS